MTINLNGKAFAPFRSGVSKGQTGVYRRYAQSLVLFNQHAERIGVINKHGVLCKATKGEDGKYWYSYGDIPEIGEFPSYTAKVTEVATALRETNPAQVEDVL